jgi:large repetitive protein
VRNPRLTLGRGAFALAAAWVSMTAFAQPSLEMSSTGSSTASVPPTSSIVVTLVRNSDNPTGNTFVPFTPTVTATYTIKNQQFAMNTTTETPVGGALMLGGTSTTGSNLMGNISPYGPLNGIGSPANNMLTALPTITAGTGIDVTQNYGARVFTSARSLFNAGFNTPAGLAGRYYMGDLEIVYSRPITQPLLHITGLGGQYQASTTVPSPGGPVATFTLGFTTEAELDLANSTPGITGLTRLSGNNAFTVSGTNITNNAVNPSASCATNVGACGTVQILGTEVTKVTLKLYLRGDGGVIAGSNADPPTPAWSSNPGHTGDAWYISTSDLAPVEVAGRVYRETGGNTTDNGNATDPGIVTQVSIECTNPPYTAGPVTTNADGTYSFPNVPASANCTITEVQPPLYANAYNTPGTGATQGNNTTTLTIASVPITGTTGNNFAETFGSVSGRVYELAPNTGIGGQTINLTGTDAAGNPVSLTTTTNPDGSYTFANVPMSNAAGYTITQPNQPSGTVNVLPAAGDNGGTPSNPTATSSQIAGVVLSAGDPIAAGNDFPETTLTTVSGRVYRESVAGNTTDDGNAVDPGIGGVTMTLTYTPPGGGAAVTVSTTTNPDGTYSFANIPVGATNATITETQPIGFASAYNTPGTAATQGNNTTTLTIATIPSAGSSGNNFAESLGSVAGRVFNQATTAGIGGQTINLTGTDAGGNPVSLTTTTQPDGSYSFTNVPLSNAAGYTISQPNQPPATSNVLPIAGDNGGTPSNPTATSSQISGVVLSAADAVSNGNNFPEAPLTTVSGRVYRESVAGNTTDDGNAVDPGIAGVTMTLTYTPPGGGAAVTLTTTTNPDGTYSFANIPIGATNATIAETQPAGFASAYNTPGTAATQGNNTTTLTIATIPAAGSPGNNFAEALGSVAGRVYDQTTSVGIGGQTINLTGTDAAGNTVSLTTTTNPDGTYAFANVPLSNAAGYTISQPNQPPSTANALPIAGDNSGTPSNPTATSSQIAGVVLSAADATSSSNDFPELPLIAISGRVYRESVAGNTTDNGNAIDPGIGGVTISLAYTPLGGGAVVTVTTTTNPDGTYSFANVPVGATNATITETQPAIYANAYNTPGSNGATQGNNTTTLTLATITSAGSANNNFAETLGSVSGKVFNQGTNTGFAGQTINLIGTDAAGNSVSLTTTTNPDGTYAFVNVPLSNAAGYTIAQPNQPPGSTNASPIPGSTGGVASNPTSTSSALSGVALLASAPNSVNNNFPEIVSATISGIVYVDTNRNNALDASDTARIGAVTVTLYAADGTTVLATKQTNVDGTYSFGVADGVFEGGTFVVRETQPAAYANAGTNPGTNASSTAANEIRVTSVPATGSANNNFGEIGGSIGGSVTNMTSGTPIPGQTITLAGNDAAGNPVSLTTQTLADGTYVFSNIPLSSATGYTVTQPNQPPNTSNGPTTAGTTGGAPTPVSTPASSISGVLVNGTTVVTLDSRNNNFAENSIIDLATATTATTNPDGTGTFTVVTRNVGAQLAPNVRTVTQLPTGLTGVIASNGGTYDPVTGLVSWPVIGNIAAGGSTSFTIQVPVTPGVTINAQTTTASFALPADSVPLAESSGTNNPSAAALGGAANAVPTMSLNALALLALLLGAFAMFGRRRLVGR